MFTMGLLWGDPKKPINRTEDLFPLQGDEVVGGEITKEEVEAALKQFEQQLGYGAVSES